MMLDTFAPLCSWFLLGFLPLAAPAQEGAAVEVAGPEDVRGYQATVTRIVEASLADGRAYELLGQLCRTAPHRLSGSDGAARAVAWGERTMKTLGFENVRLEPCTVPHWVRGDVERLGIVEPASARGEALPIRALGGSVATAPGGLVAEVIEVRSFDELKQRAEEAKGRIVLFNEPMRPLGGDTMAAYGVAVQQRVHGASEAAAVGAVGSLVRSVSTRLDDFPHTGNQRYRDGVERVPTAAVSTLGADRLARQIAAARERGAYVTLKLELDCKQLEDVESFNVVGEWVGRERPDEVVVVGGHLDCWDVGEGAHDDGGGCCQALEVVRLLRELELRPRRTVRVVLFMNEENGLGGGNAYYARHLEEMPKHVAALESDSGVMSPRGFTTDAGPRALPLLCTFAEWLEPFGAGVMRAGEGGADIGPMAASGVPQFGYLPDVLRYFDMHHSDFDTFEQVSPNEINLGAGTMAALVYVLADMPRPLARNE